ncbi:hypothetical protein NFT50_003577 [Salmonella enterica]|nr:hypothetical protein [Salmonella enterica]EJH7441440.1 hypothetical protein [Salmonella enterica]EJH7879540.1 hypothetical protein [Salmonella enterica]EJI6712452.1 hypothetical protein [Salmonella enterica]
MNISIKFCFSRFTTGM